MFGFVDGHCIDGVSNWNNPGSSRDVRVSSSSVLVMRLTADGPMTLNFTVRFDGKLRYNLGRDSDDLVVNGVAPIHVTASYQTSEDPLWCSRIVVQLKFCLRCLMRGRRVVLKDFAVAVDLK